MSYIVCNNTADALKTVCKLEPKPNAKRGVKTYEIIKIPVSAVINKNPIEIPLKPLMCDIAQNVKILHYAGHSPQHTFLKIQNKNMFDVPPVINILAADENTKLILHVDAQNELTNPIWISYDAIYLRSDLRSNHLMQNLENGINQIQIHI